MSQTQPWQIERRSHDVIVVRVVSRDRHGNPLPDTCFTFREGDSQYALWDGRLRAIESGAASLELSSASH